MITFREVPDEVTLCINISECPLHCKGCHSPQLQESIGSTLDWGNLNALIYINSGITCVAFMGGDSSPKTINYLAEKVKRLGLKTCWYSGREQLPEQIQLQNFDYIKLGPYREEFGPLDNPKTNQKFFQVKQIDDQYSLEDITSKFWRQVQ